LRALAEILKIFLAISNALLYPVLISLILLVIYTFFAIGKTFSEYASRREGKTLFSIPPDYIKSLKEGKLDSGLIALFRDNRQLLIGEAEAMQISNKIWKITDGLISYQIKVSGKKAGVYISRSSEIEQNINDMEIGEDIRQSMASEQLALFYKELREVMKYCRVNKNNGLIATKVARLLEAREREAAKVLERNRVLIRVGPMLGLMGTLIPLGPALVALSGGNINELSSNLIVAFSSTVVGLLIGAVFLTINMVTRRWYMQDLRDMEYIAEYQVASTGTGKAGISDMEAAVPFQ
jgi:biopolymer transport protein ExbB/TolQ